MIALSSFVAVALSQAATPSYRKPTPASVTTPKAIVACEMTSLMGEQFSLGLEQTGGRGYSRAAIREGAQGVGWTPIQTLVTKDSSGRYEGLELVTVSAEQRGWPGVKRTRVEAGGRFRVQFLSAATSTPNRISLVIQPKWPLDQVSASGFCQVEEIPQQPLSDDEAAELYAS